MIAKEQYDEEEYDGCYNIGPNEEDCVTIKRLVDLFCKYWGENLKWENRYIEGPHEANFLKLDCSKIKRTFKWSPKWDIEKAIEKTVEFAKAYRDNENVPEYMNKQIQEYMS